MTNIILDKDPNLKEKDAFGNIKHDSVFGGHKQVPASSVLWADRIIKAEKEKGVWAAIEEMINCWKASKPQEYNSLIVDITDKKKSRGNKTGGSSKSSMRYLADIPEMVWGLVVTFYGDKKIIDPYDAKFFHQFAKRFPEFSVAERI
jgi:hypothetical protein